MNVLFLLSEKKKDREYSYNYDDTFVILKRKLGKCRQLPLYLSKLR